MKRYACMYHNRVEDGWGIVDLYEARFIPSVKIQDVRIAEQTCDLMNQIAELGASQGIKVS